MDVREKLVELLRNKPRVKPPEGVICGTEVYSIDATVDYLIANGVTVQEWISVRDRLPIVSDEECEAYVKDKGYPFLVSTKYGDVDIEVFWVKAQCFDNPDINYWMPRPQPPKGE